VTILRGVIVPSHNDLPGLTTGDPHTQYAFLAGRASGQTLIGGTAVGEDLTLQASTTQNATNAVRLDTRLAMDETWHATGALYPFTLGGTYTETALAATGTFNLNGTVNVNTIGFLYDIVLANMTFNQQVAPLIAAFQLFRANVTIQNNGANTLMTAIVLNGTVIHKTNATGGVCLISGRYEGSRSAPRYNADTSGDTLTHTQGSLGFNYQPEFTTVAGAAVNMGPLIGFQSLGPTVQGSSPGTVTYSDYWGFSMSHPSALATTAGTVAAFQSFLQPGTNRFFLRNTGAARSNFGGGNVFNIGELAGVVSVDPALGSSQNNYAGWVGSTTLRITPSAAISLTGLSATTAEVGTILHILNMSAVNTLTLVHESGASSAANRFFFSTGANLVIQPLQIVTVMYTNTRWRRIE